MTHGPDGSRRPRRPHRRVREGHRARLDQLSLRQGPVEAARHRRRGAARRSRSRRREREKRVAACLDARVTTSPISARSATCATRPRRSSRRSATARRGEVWDSASDVFKKQETRRALHRRSRRSIAHALGNYKRLLDGDRSARRSAARPRRSTCVAEFEKSSGVRVDVRLLAHVEDRARGSCAASRSSCRCRARRRRRRTDRDAAFPGCTSPLPDARSDADRRRRAAEGRRLDVLDSR